MDEKIKGAMEQVYTGESKALLRLQVYAKKAEEEGFPQIAKLFRVIAFSEWLHGSRALKYLREIKSTEENLKLSFESETKVAGIAYEVIRYAGKHKDSLLARALVYPGLMMQKITTREPEPQMIEVAIRSLESVLEQERDRRDDAAAPAG